MITTPLIQTFFSVDCSVLEGCYIETVKYELGENGNTSMMVKNGKDFVIDANNYYLLVSGSVLCEHSNGVSSEIFSGYNSSEWSSYKSFLQEGEVVQLKTSSETKFIVLNNANSNISMLEICALNSGESTVKTSESNSKLIVLGDNFALNSTTFNELYDAANNYTELPIKVSKHYFMFSLNGETINITANNECKCIYFKISY